MAPKVSVVLPVYNVAKYLHQCADSLLAQTLRDVEFIFVNDGSPDNSLEILNAYAAKDNRIRIVSQKNRGVGPARNVGIELAVGDYLSFLDPDDYFEPTLLEDTYNCAVANDADVVLFSYSYFDNQTGKVSTPTEGQHFENLPEGVFAPEVVADSFSMNILASACVKIYRREFILDEHLQFPNLKCAEDHYFSYMSFLTAKRIVKLDKRLYYYRRNRESSAMWKAAPHLLMSHCEVLRAIRNDLTERGLFEKFYKGFYAKVQNDLQYCFNVLNLKQVSFQERREVCREFHIRASLFSLLGCRAFIREHSPKWFIKLVRAVRGH